MRLVRTPELGPLMTFELSKEKPVHGWFWYKEGYAPELVRYSLGRKPAKTVLDPFCGVGTTLLACKEAGVDSAGVDASPLAVFVSKAKCEDYAPEELDAALAFLQKNPYRGQGGAARGGSRRAGDRSGGIEGGPRGPGEYRGAPLNWQFELFDPRAAFPRRNYGEILAIRQAIENEEGRVRDLLLLALLSVLPQASIVMKDGGVLKIDKRKRALPAREIFRRKVKRMARELGEPRPQGHVPAVFLGDARSLELDSGSVDLIVTSPPYLNNIDYSKVYGLELSLLSMSKAAAEQMRMRAIRSFIRKGGGPEGSVPPEAGDVGLRIPIIGTYFRDMEAALAEMHRVLADGGEAHIVVSNSVIHETHVMVDEVLAQIGERIGFAEAEILVGAERVADVRPQRVRTRESMIILRK